MLRKNHIKVLFDEELDLSETPLIYQMASIKHSKDVPVYRIVECSAYNTSNMVINGFYKPIIKLQTKE